MVSRSKRKVNLPGYFPKRRSRTGCLTCRRRRKKCDETEPICKACSRNFLKCEWAYDKVSQNPATRSIFSISTCTSAQFIKYPQNTNWVFKSFSVNFKNGRLLEYNSESLIFFEINDFPSCNEEIIKIPDISLSPGNLSLASRSVDVEPLTLDLKLESSQLIDIPIDNNAKSPIYRRSQYTTLANAEDPETVRFNKLFQMCKQEEPVPESEFKDVNMEKFLFYSCLKGYIPKMTTQYTHSSLTTEATFIPQVEKNLILMEVCLCCGATYLAWNNVQKFQNVSDELYINCKLMIRNYINDNENFANEDWLFAALQLMCNRDKNSLTGTSDDAAWYLVKAYDIIKIRYYGIRSENFDHMLIKKLENPNLILQPQERTLIESFIYQYSVSVLFVWNFKGLPNPFKIFKILNIVLQCPVYNCENVVDWMRNPILGSSLDSFEILAKLSFIGRQSRRLDDKCLKQVLRLRNMCEYYTSAAPSQPMDQDPWRHFKINSIVGIVTAKACWLFATKLLYFDSIDLKDHNIQEHVGIILMHLEKIPVGHSVWGILSWCLLVTGIFVTDHDQKAIILNYIQLWSKRTHSYNSFKIATFLRRAWMSSDAPGFLFNRAELNNVCM